MTIAKKLLIISMMILFPSPVWSDEVDGNALECAKYDQKTFYEFTNGEVHKYIFLPSMQKNMPNMNRALEKNFGANPDKKGWSKMNEGSYTAYPTYIHWVPNPSVSSDRQLNRETLKITETGRPYEVCRVITPSERMLRMKLYLEDYYEGVNRQRRKNKL